MINCPADLGLSHPRRGALYLLGVGNTRPVMGSDRSLDCRPPMPLFMSRSRRIPRLDASAAFSVCSMSSHSPSRPEMGPPPSSYPVTVPSRRWFRLYSSMLSLTFHARRSHRTSLAKARKRLLNGASSLATHLAAR